MASSGAGPGPQVRHTHNVAFYLVTIKVYWTPMGSAIFFSKQREFNKVFS